MNMKEKMARAMAVNSMHGCDPDAEVTCQRLAEYASPFGMAFVLPPTQARAKFWQLFLGPVTTALDALMEPTEGMVDACMNVGSFPMCDGECTVRWEAMIRAAKDGK